MLKFQITQLKISRSNCILWAFRNCFAGVTDGNDVLVKLASRLNSSGCEMGGKESL